MARQSTQHCKLLGPLLGTETGQQAQNWDCWTAVGGEQLPVLLHQAASRPTQPSACKSVHLDSASSTLHVYLATGLRTEVLLTSSRINLSVPWSTPLGATGKTGLVASSSKTAELCRYICWGARMGPVLAPYFQLPLSGRWTRRLFHFWLGANTFPFEMGRRLHIAGMCPLCPGMHVGDEPLSARIS